MNLQTPIIWKIPFLRLLTISVPGVFNDITTDRNNRTLIYWAKVGGTPTHHSVELHNSERVKLSFFPRSAVPPRQKPYRLTSTTHGQDLTEKRRYPLQRRDNRVIKKREDESQSPARPNVYELAKYFIPTGSRYLCVRGN